jgi:dipeptidyl aminopeptidase/acylaminoacyl peptidase
MPGGKRIVFASDQGEYTSIKTIALDGGEPHLVRTESRRVLPLGITDAGELYLGVRSGQTDVFVTALGAPAGKAMRATLRFPGRNTMPAWSADGKRLAYLSRRGQENFGQESRVIVVRNPAANEERELAPKLAHIERVRWSDDGRTLLAAGSDGKGRSGLFLVDASTAATRPLVAEPDGPFRGFEAVWGAGDTVYYIYAEREVRSTKGAKPVYQGKALRRLAISPGVKALAVADADGKIAVLPLDGGPVKTLHLKGMTELEWGRDLIAANGDGLWKLPLDGAAPERIPAPGNRLPGFSLHPDGETVALTAGDRRSEVWSMVIH